MLRRLMIGLLTIASLGAGSTVHAYAVFGGVAHVVTHPLAVSTTMLTEHQLASPRALVDWPSTTRQAQKRS